MALSAVTVDRDVEKVVAFLTGPLCVAAGVSIAANHEKITKGFKEKFAPWFLKLIYGSDAYDEALLRSYRDKFNGRLQQLVQFLMKFSCASLVFFTLFTNNSSSDWYYTMMFSLFYTPIFHNRLAKAMDPYNRQFEGGGYMGRNIYLFYPLLDEHSDFQRSQKMRVTTSLKRKRWVLATARYQQVLLYTFFNSILAGIAWSAHKQYFGISRFAYVHLTASSLMIADYIGYGPINLIDKIHQYVAIEFFDLPVASISFPNFFRAKKSNFDSITSQPMAHYNQNLGPLKPYGLFWHKNGFTKFRGDGYSLGSSMVFTNAIRCAIMLAFIALTSGPSNKQTFRTMALVTVNYLGHAAFQFVDADEATSITAHRDYKKHGETQIAIFGWYRFFTAIFDYLFFACPLASYMLMPMSS